MNKTLTNTTANQTKDQVKDIQFWGNGDTFQLICKASSEAEGWMKSTKAMEVSGIGCVIQVTTQQKGIDGTYTIAEALTFVPGATIESIVDQFTGKIVSRKVVVKLN